MFLFDTRFKLVRVLVRYKRSVRLPGSDKLVLLNLYLFVTRLTFIVANIPPLKKKLYTKNFKKELLDDPQLKDWLWQDAKNLDACCCVCCEVQLKNANKSMLITHMKSAKHKKSLN